MAGIVRIHIISDWNNARLKMSRDMELSANDLHFSIWDSLNMPLLDGVEIVECTKQDAAARYDWKEGIDVILQYKNGHRATMQEKYLEYHTSTATFTEHQKYKPGAWYTSTAQYWWIGYALDYWKGKSLAFRDWMLIDFPGLHRLDAKDSLPWHYTNNEKPGYEGISFRWIYFDEVPSSVIVARAVTMSRGHVLSNQDVLIPGASRTP